MFLRRPLFAGKHAHDQLARIMRLLGSPSKQILIEMSEDLHMPTLIEQECGYSAPKNIREVCGFAIFLCLMMIMFIMLYDNVNSVILACLVVEMLIIISSFYRKAPLTTAVLCLQISFVTYHESGPKWPMPYKIHSSMICATIS